MVTRQNFQEALEKAIPSLRGYEQSSHERKDIVDTVFKATAYFDNHYFFDVKFMPRVRSYKVVVGKFRVNESPDGNTFELIDKPLKLVSSGYLGSVIYVYKKMQSFDYSSNNFVTLYSSPNFNYISHLIFLASVVAKF